MAKTDYMKNKISQLLKDKLTKLKQKEELKFAALNLGYPQKEKEKNKEVIQKKIKFLEDIHIQLLPLIRELKGHMKDITDQTAISACYFLLGSIFNTWKAIFQLALEGRYKEVMVLLRYLIEKLELTSLFILSDEDTDLKKWFSGEIIMNKKARDILSKLMEETIESLDARNMSDDLYSVISEYSHGSYLSLLESVDAYHYDLDFDMYSGYNLMSRNMHLLQAKMFSTLVCLRGVFLKGLKTVKYDQTICDLMLQVSDKDVSEAAISEITNKYKKAPS